MLQQLNSEKKLITQFREKFIHASNPGVSIIACTNKPNYIDNIFKNYTRSNYQKKELIIILNNNKMSLKKCITKANDNKDIRVFQIDESCTLGQCLNYGVGQSKYDYISKMDDDDYYGSNYLEDLMNVFKYTKAQVTGKLTYFVYFECNNTLGIMCKNHEFENASAIAGGTILAKKEVFQKVKFRNFKSGTDSNFLQDCLNAKLKIYSSDKYNYLLIRHTNLKDHTWKIKSEEFIKYVDKVSITSNYIPFVTA